MSCDRTGVRRARAQPEAHRTALVGPYLPPGRARRDHDGQHQEGGVQRDVHEAQGDLAHGRVVDAAQRVEHRARDPKGVGGCSKGDGGARCAALCKDEGQPLGVRLCLRFLAPQEQGGRDAGRGRPGQEGQGHQHGALGHEGVRRRHALQGDVRGPLGGQKQGKDNSTGESEREREGLLI